MTYRPVVTRSVGYPDLTAVYTAATVGAPGITDLPSVTTAAQPGEVVDAWDPVNGYGQFIFLSVPVSTTITAGLLYSWQANGTNGSAFAAQLMPTSVASQGVSGWPMAVAVNAVTSNANAIQYTWFQIKGYCTVLKAGTIKFTAASSCFLSSATQGRVRSTASVFRAILGMRLASSTTIATTVSVLPVYINNPTMQPGL